MNYVFYLFFKYAWILCSTDVEKKYVFLNVEENFSCLIQSSNWIFSYNFLNKIIAPFYFYLVFHTGLLYFVVVKPNLDIF